MSWSPLAVWLWSRLAVAVTSAAGVWALSGRPASTVPGPVERWARWDVDLLRKVAEFGYVGARDRRPDEPVEAFFPGFPAVLRAVHVVVPDWTAAGLVISLVAGAVGAVALGRIAALDGVDPGRTVLLWVTAPPAVFLAAGYTEALFLAVALPAWLAARSGRWAAAGLLVALACTVRINGAFLGVALVVQYLVASRGRLRWDVLWLLAPAVPLVGYATYLRATTGDWLRWFAAQEEGWQRRLTWPWDAFERTLDSARSSRLAADYVLSYAVEIGAVAVGLGLTAVLLSRRRWAEATYVGLSVGALATSTFYLSVARSSLLWFPLWVLLAQAASRRPWVLAAYLSLAAPMSVVGVVAFTNGRWWG